MEQLIVLFNQYTEKSNPKIEVLPLSGSNRRYYRLTEGDISIIGVIGKSKEENRAFVELSRHFTQQQLNTPKVYAVSEDGMAYIQEDLGDIVLFDKIRAGRNTGVFGPLEKELLHTTISHLADIQIKGADGLDFSVCFPQPEFNRRSVMWDLNYFKYNFLKTTGMEFQEDLLEDDFDKMADRLLKDDANAFLFRDFQSRNVMLVDNKPYFIDYQGGRRGPIYYDVASFLWQARANYSADLREELIDTYINSLRKYQKVDKYQFMAQLRQFVLFRTLQVLGAYGFRGYYEKKPHFLQSIPFALNNLRELLKEDFSDYPYLIELLKEMVDLKQFAATKKKDLHLRIFSFAYKKGIPNDSSGHGGGYVYDCRAINNPGKYERYKKVTGLDKEVIDFLEKDGEMAVFLDHVFPLVDQHVQRYIDRGFTDLMVSFGCTGGQHRSVYAAQNLAEHISDKFGIQISLVHREQNIEQRFLRKEITKEEK